MKYAGYAVDAGQICPSCQLGEIEPRQLVSDQTPLMAGDKFILYTDNLLLLKSSHGEEFGADRCHAILQRASHESAEGMLQVLSTEVNRFRDESVDDEGGLVLVIERDPGNVASRVYPEATGFPYRVQKSLTLAGIGQ